MKRHVAFLFIFLLSSVPLITQQFRTCVRVIDGDTIVLDGNETIRLIGVDTPETKDPRKPVQYYGQEAYEFTRKLVEGKKVRLEYDQDRTDKYGRTLAYVYLEDGIHVNAQIILMGFGHAYTQYPFKYMEAFRSYEKLAREAGLGLWNESASAAKQEAKPQISTNDNVTVYITKTGAKYHSAGCQYLRRSSIPISLKDAVARGHTPCSRCNPPRLK
jgi:micrococcal nuclease